MENQKWTKWLGLMDTYIKHDVTLYQLKNVYEKTMVNPRISLEQEGMLDGLGHFDLLLTYVYEYDGGVIGAGGHYQVLEDTMGLGTDDDSKEVLDQKEKEFYDRVDEIFFQKESIRIGLYNCRTGFQPSFHVISTHEEESKYYVKDLKILYDDIINQLYYRIRYGISSKAYYVLSGMSEWTDDIFNEIVAPPCPRNNDHIDEHRFYTEYLEGVDLEAIRKDLHEIDTMNWKDLKKIETKYAMRLSHGLLTFIKENL